MITWDAYLFHVRQLNAYKQQKSSMGMVRECYLVFYFMHFLSI